MTATAIGPLPVGAYDALTATGTTVELRPFAVGDEPALHEFLAEVSDDSSYRRFFTASRAAGDDYIDHLSDRGHTVAAVVVLDRGVIAGVGSLHASDPSSRPVEAEVALLVDDRHQGQGIGTLILEDLLARALVLGIDNVDAMVQPANHGMLDVFARSGFAVRQEFEHGEVSVRCRVDAGADAIRRVAERQAHAETASLDHVLRPSSVAVVGAGKHASTVGRQVLEHLTNGGFTGPLYAVNPDGLDVGAVPGFTAVSAIQEPVDLVVLAVRSDQVLPVARDCAAAGTKALLTLTAGFGEVGEHGGDDQAELLRICRRSGMRLIGPNCIGVANTDPSVRLDATFLPRAVTPGATGVLSQSGAVTVGLMDELERRGAGISSLVTVGNKADVGGNDVLPWWESDARTRVLAVYLESIAHPIPFTQLAERLSRTTPIVLLKAGRSPAAASAARSHTAAAADDDAAVDALCRSGSVIRVDSLGELADVAAIAGMQPLPRGPRVAVVGNSGGPAVLATDACVADGLVVAQLAAATTQGLSDLLPASAAVNGPVDVTAGATLAQLQEAIELTAADPGVDVVLTVLTVLSHLPVNGLIEAQDQVAAAHPETTFVTCIFGDRLDLHGTVPRLRQPEDAVRAVARLSAYASRRPNNTGSDLSAVESATKAMDLAAIRALVQEVVHVAGDSWLPAVEAYRLLEHCGFTIAPVVTAEDAETAAEASAFLRFPVVVKADGPELLHKSDQGAVLLDLTGPEQVRAGVHDLERRLGDRMRSVLVQTQVHGGAEIIVGATRDPRFGPLIMLGRGGVNGDVDPDRTWAMTPVGPATAAQMIADLRSAPVLRGHRGQPPADLEQLADVITRVSRLMVEVPEISEIDLNPVLARAQDAVVVDVRVRVRPAPAPELLDHVRHLR